MVGFRTGHLSHLWPWPLTLLSTWEAFCILNGHRSYILKDNKIWMWPSGKSQISSLFMHLQWVSSLASFRKGCVILCFVKELRTHLSRKHKTHRSVVAIRVYESRSPMREEISSLQRALCKIPSTYKWLKSWHSFQSIRRIKYLHHRY